MYISIDSFSANLLTIVVPSRTNKSAKRSRRAAGLVSPVKGWCVSRKRVASGREPVVVTTFGRGFMAPSRTDEGEERVDV